MKAYLWTAALVFAAFMSVLTGSGASQAEDSDEPTDAASRKQMVWDMQIKYATYAIGAAGVGILAFWVLSKSNQGKKKHAADLKKLERLDPNEGMPIN